MSIVFFHNVSILLTYLSIILAIHFTNGQPFNYDADDTLILTSLIESGNVTFARSLAKVSHPDFNGIESYSGYFTVNESCGSNLFFWFFPAENNPETAPVVLYLNGGPGSSSMLCTLAENGPITLLENGEIMRSNYSWSQYYNLIYIDNPVNVGFSFTKNKNCLAKEETRIGTELHEALMQFFQLFPNLQKNEFYLSGLSYAGHYIPATAYTIHKKNPTSKIKINLKGLAIANGLVDHLLQHRYSTYLYEIGLVDEDGQKQLEDAENELKNAIESEKWELASKLVRDLIWDITADSLYTQLTGLKHYHDYIVGDDGTSLKYFQEYLNQKDVKQALHTGNVEYVLQSWEVMFTLILDIVKGVTPMLVEILNSGYKVMLYNGQLDICVAYPLTRDLVNQMEFKGKSEFQAAKRYIWEVDQDIAGYVREGGNLTLALVRNAGHVTSVDKPKWVRNLLLGFTHPKYVEFKGNRRTVSENKKPHKTIHHEL